MAIEEFDFEQGDSGASATYPQQCSSLRKNGHVMIKGRPCKIVEMSTSKTGKHGHAKVHLVGIDLFTNKKLEDLCPSTHNMDVPNIEKKDYYFLSFEEGDSKNVVLIDEGGETRDDLEIHDEELIKKIKRLQGEGKEDIEVKVQKFMDEEVIISVN